MSKAIDASDLMALSRDLGKISAGTTRLAFAAFAASADDLQSTWRNNAAQTAGKHGKHYPKSITTSARVGFNIEFEIGPDPRLRQGGMSFEYGSKNQPPHLDGQKAMDAVEPRIHKRIDDALAGIAAAVETGNESKLYEYTTKAGVTRTATQAQIANWTRGRAA